MEPETRHQRIADMLERQLASCNAALSNCLRGAQADEIPDEWPLKRMLSLMKVSSQLANAIVRADMATPRLSKNEV